MLKANDLALPEEYLNDGKDEDMQYDLDKPNSHLNDPIFPGLTWTACDFALLGDYLSNKLVSYIEGRDCESDAMERLLDMKDECSRVFSNSEFFKEHQDRLAQRKREREEREL